MSDLAVAKKKSFHINLKSFSWRAKCTKKHCFYFIITLILLLPLFVPNPLAPILQAAATGQYGQSPSFTFTAVGDIGGNISTSRALALIGQSCSEFPLGVRGLSYSELTCARTWCSD